MIFISAALYNEDDKKGDAYLKNAKEKRPEMIEHLCEEIPPHANIWGEIGYLEA